jgi:chromosome partitioning protein
MAQQDSPLFITLGNRKGGVGKTTSVINLASYLAILGKKILIIDTDPQANCSSILLKNFTDRDTHSLVTLLEAPADTARISQAVCETYHDNIKIIPNTTRCMLWERNIGQNADAVLGIKRLLQKDSGVQHYDFVLFDTPPNLGAMMNNALMASDYVVIPIPPSDQFSLDGLAAYLDLIQGIRKHNQHLKLLAVLITKYDPNWGNSASNLSQIQEYLSQRGISIFHSHIHNCPEIDMAHVSRQPIFEYAPNSISANDFAAFGKELLEVLTVIHGKRFI